MEREGRLAAGGVFHLFRDTVELIYNGSDDALLDLRPNHALYWGVIRWCAEHGYGGVRLRRGLPHHLARALQVPVGRPRPEPPLHLARRRRALTRRVDGGRELRGRAGRRRPGREGLAAHARCGSRGSARRSRTDTCRHTGRVHFPSDAGLASGRVKDVRAGRVTEDAVERARAGEPPAPGISAVTIGLGLREQGLHRAPPHAPHARACNRLRQRPAARGKFLWTGDEKLYVRGVTYGTFSRDGDGHQYPPLDVVAADFARMAANGLNAVRTYTAAASLAARHGARTRTVGDGRARLGATRGLSREPCASALDRGSGAVGRGRLRRPSRGAVLRGRQRDPDPRRAVGRPGAGREVHRAPARRRAAGGPRRAVHIRQLPVDRVPRSRRRPTSSRYNVYLESPAQLEALSGPRAEPRRRPAAADGRARPRQPRTRNSAGRPRRSTGRSAPPSRRAARARSCSRGRTSGTSPTCPSTGQGNGSVEMRDWDFGLTDRERRAEARACGSAQGVPGHALRSRPSLAARIGRRLHLQRRTHARTLPRGARARSTIPTSR